MKIYYDLKKNEWFHTLPSETVFSIGEKHKTVRYDRRQSLKDCLPFHVKRNGQKVGPVIGILVSNKRNKFYGNIPLFKRIQRQLFELGGFSICFPIDQLLRGNLSGYCYIPSSNHWVLINDLVPDTFYNRLLRNDEHKLKLLNEMYTPPFFNRQFFDKWELYSVLSQDSLIEKHLPKTLLLTEFNFNEYLNTYSSFYVKERESSKGAGIFLVERERENIVIQTVEKKFVFSIVKEAWNFLKMHTNDCIIQETIPSLHWHGNKFDLRLFVHFIDDHYEISGTGVRVSQGQQITTHVPNGGIIGTLNELPITIDYPLLQTLMNKCGKLLTKKISFVGEFSADIGITPTGHYYIYELNSKPMDFDEPTIKQKGTENLIHTFYNITSFPWRNQKTFVENKKGNNLKNSILIKEIVKVKTNRLP